MWFRRLLLIVLMLPMGFGSAMAHAQTVFLNTGVLLINGDGFEDVAATTPVMQIGSRFWYTDLFQLKTAFTYQGALAGEAALVVRPFADRFERAEPYAFVGFGRFFGNEMTVFDPAEGSDMLMLRRSVIPLGIGGSIGRK